MRVATRRLLAAADLEYEPVSNPGKRAIPEKNNIWIRQCMRHALAYHLTDNQQYFDNALKDLRALAQAYLTWPLRESHIRAASYGLSESRFTMGLAAAYDLLAAVDLEAADRDLFEEALALTRETTDRCQHRTCGNHNTWNLAARLAVGIALGSRPDIQDALWGWSFEGVSRYGFVHQLRHDLLSDGLHWEVCHTFRGGAGSNTQARLPTLLMGRHAFDEHSAASDRFRTGDGKVEGHPRPKPTGNSHWQGRMLTLQRPVETGKHCIRIPCLLLRPCAMFCRLHAHILIRSGRSLLALSARRCRRASLRESDGRNDHDPSTGGTRRWARGWKRGRRMLSAQAPVARLMPDGT